MQVEVYNSRLLYIFLIASDWRTYIYIYIYIYIIITNITKILCHADPALPNDIKLEDLGTDDFHGIYGCMYILHCKKLYIVHTRVHNI